MMYAAVRGALGVDDAAERQGNEPKFKVRDTPDWRKHTADLESEMLRRGMMFEIIDWAEGRSQPLSARSSIPCAALSRLLLPSDFRLLRLDRSTQFVLQRTMSVAMLRFGHGYLFVSAMSIAERATRPRSSTYAARISSKSCLWSSSLSTAVYGCRLRRCTDSRCPG